MTPLPLAVRLFAGRVAALRQSGRPSAIAKQVVCGPVLFQRLGMAGDEQADRRVHGGPDKAIHLYPPGHYERLAARFPELAAHLQAGSIGENISPAGFAEADFHLGDILRLGEARLQLCQPRTPCWKIDEHFACDGLAAFIAEQGLAGWYLRVVGEGLVTEADRLEVLERYPHAPSLSDTLALVQAHRPDLGQLAALTQLPALAEGWRSKLLARLAWLQGHAASST